MSKWNITIDHKDGMCNIIFSALSPYYKDGVLVYYKYEEKQDKYIRHTIDMNDVIGVAFLRVDEDD